MKTNQKNYIQYQINYVDIVASVMNQKISSIQKKMQHATNQIAMQKYAIIHYKKYRQKTLTSPKMRIKKTLSL